MAPLSPTFYSFLFTLLWLALVFTADAHKHGCKDGEHIPGRCRAKFLRRNHCKKESWNKRTKGISQDLLDEFRLMSQYSAAAYWPGNNNSTDNPIECSSSHCKYRPEGNCPLVEAAKATTIVEFKDTPHFDDHGFIAIDPKNKLVVLSFRGSHSNQNWIEDFKIALICSDLCPTCRVHHGFWESWTGMRDMIIPNVLAATKAHPHYRFIVTGHSLGAAIATLAAADIRKRNKWLHENTELYTFGSPRVGSVATADFLSKQSKKNYRITATADPVPRAPPPLFGYMHMSPEYWISRNGEDPKAKDVHVLTGYYNEQGNTGTDFKTFEDHRKYFEYITKCDPDPPSDPDKKAWWRFIVEGIL